MPGKLFIDPLQTGVHAYKPIEAHAYCEGYLAFMSIAPRNPPPGLNGESLALWLQGYDDAGAGKAAESCGYPAGESRGPELIPDPFFQTWSGAANPDNTPAGWALSGQDVNEEYFDPATPTPTGIRTVSGAGANNLLTSLGATPDALTGYELKYVILAQPGNIVSIVVGGTTVQFSGSIGTIMTATFATVDASAILIGPRGSTNADESLSGVSVRAVL